MKRGHFILWKLFIKFTSKHRDRGFGFASISHLNTFFVTLCICILISRVGLQRYRDKKPLIFLSYLCFNLDCTVFFLAILKNKKYSQPLQLIASVHPFFWTHYLSEIRALPDHIGLSPNFNANVHNTLSGIFC